MNYKEHKYNKGDLVRIVCDVPAFGWGPVKKGDIAEVIGYSGGGILALRHPEHESWSCHEHEVEPYGVIELDLNVPPPPKFNDEFWADFSTPKKKKKARRRQGKII